MVDSSAQAPDGIPEDRPLTTEERTFVRWLLLNGESMATGYLADLEQAWVMSRCRCGCVSVDFAFAGRPASPNAGMEILADLQLRDPDGYLGGVFVYAKAGQLAGIDVWSIDGSARTDELPQIDRLEPLYVAPANEVELGGNDTAGLLAKQASLWRRRISA